MELFSVRAELRWGYIFNYMNFAASNSSEHSWATSTGEDWWHSNQILTVSISEVELRLGRSCAGGVWKSGNIVVMKTD